jgi:hypothetical protein
MALEGLHVKAWSATWNLGTNSVFGLRWRKTTGNVRNDSLESRPHWSPSRGALARTADLRQRYILTLASVVSNLASLVQEIETKSLYLIIAMLSKWARAVLILRGRSRCLLISTTMPARLAPAERSAFQLPLGLEHNTMFARKVRR